MDGTLYTQAISFILMGPFTQVMQMLMKWIASTSQWSSYFIQGCRFSSL